MSFFFWVQEWPEEDYPPYANGPGYIVSSDIAQFIISEFEKHKLRVCCFVLLSNLFSLSLSLSLYIYIYVCVYVAVAIDEY